MMRTKVLFIALAMATFCRAENIKKVVLTTNPVMHCENCENRIKASISQEKGVEGVETNLDTKTVTVSYDADVTTVENIVAGFAKINYTATLAADGKTATAKGGCCGGTSGGACGCGQKAKASGQTSKCTCSSKK